MLEKKSVFLSAVYSFAAAIISSFIFSPLFGRFYVYIFNPIMTGGLEGFGNFKTFVVIQNAIFAYLFFLPLFIWFLMPKKQWPAWLILIFIPFTMVLVGGSKHLLWFLIFTLAGGLAGWLIRTGMEKFRK